MENYWIVSHTQKNLHEKLNKKKKKMFKGPEASCVCVVYKKSLFSHSFSIFYLDLNLS